MFCPQKLSHCWAWQKTRLYGAAPSQIRGIFTFHERQQIPVTGGIHTHSSFGTLWAEGWRKSLRAGPLFLSTYIWLGRCCLHFIYTIKHVLKVLYRRKYVLPKQIYSRGAEEYEVYEHHKDSRATTMCFVPGQVWLTLQQSDGWHAWGMCPCVSNGWRTTTHTLEMVSDAYFFAHEATTYQLGSWEDETQPQEMFKSQRKIQVSHTQEISIWSVSFCPLSIPYAMHHLLQWCAKNIFHYWRGKLDINNWSIYP